MMDWLLPLVTLMLMEIVLGIDNIVFLSLLLGTLPPERRGLARGIGLSLALGARILLLLGIRHVMKLEHPLFYLSSLGVVPESWIESHRVNAITGKDLVMLGGGLFLMGKSVVEIHKKMMGDDEEEENEAAKQKARHKALAFVIVQIIVLDLVFSLDSVISAIGMAQETWIMVVAMLVAVGFMAVFSGRVSKFIEDNPTFKMLALTFLVLIGVLLVAEGMGTHINKGYIYAAMFYALAVELLNMRVRRKRRLKRQQRMKEQALSASQPQSVA